MGHLRDLPRRVSEMPAKYREMPWARLGVDVDGEFEPVYVVPKDKAARVKALRLAVRYASEVLLATDEDREGEAIAWHLLELTKPSVPVRRMVFHEITPLAIRRALDSPRELDTDLVAAQEARRVLDRLVGWDLSELLWKKVAPKLSAGRVQSVATRLVVDRERARIAFRSGSWWEVRAALSSAAGHFRGRLAAFDGRKVATGRDFDPATGTVPDGALLVLDEDAAGRIADGCAGVDFALDSVERTPWRRRPAPPFVTATLQQEAGRRYRFAASKTMQAAQRLYEAGLITYMRTDSTELSDEAIAAARAEVRERYGDDALPPEPRRHAHKGKHSQESHEAIRPTGARFTSPEDVARTLGLDEARIYELVWRRTLASQMNDATGFEVRATMSGTMPTGEECSYVASGRVVADRGFLLVWRVSGDPADSVGTRGGDREDDGEDGIGSGPDGMSDEEARRLAALAPGDVAACDSALAIGHATKPPARYTEASLVKELEHLGVGRPSTYATIMRTIVDRGYVRRAAGSLIPAWAAFAVVQLLERHFPDLVDAEFTARMEEDLDAVAEGSRRAAPWLRDFYIGGDVPGLRDQVVAGAAGIDSRAVTTIEILPHDTGETIEVHFGRYGPYVEKDNGRVGLPDDLAPDELTAAALERLAGEAAATGVPRGGRDLGVDPDSGDPVTLRLGRYGPYVQRGDGKNASRAGLLGSMDAASVDLEGALRLLSFPRLLGRDAQGAEVTLHLGRYGPYVKRGTDTRDVDESIVFSLTLGEAEALLAAPKTRKRRAPAGTSGGGPGTNTRGRGPKGANGCKEGAEARHVIAELGPHPETGRDLTVRDGKYGPYVSDGSTNATIPKGTAPQEVTLEGAVELLRRKVDSGRRTGRPPGRGGSRRRR